MGNPLAQRKKGEKKSLFAHLYHLKYFSERLATESSTALGLARKWTGKVLGNGIFWWLCSATLDSHKRYGPRPGPGSPSWSSTAAAGGSWAQTPAACGGAASTGWASNVAPPGEGQRDRKDKRETETVREWERKEKNVKESHGGTHHLTAFKVARVSVKSRHYVAAEAKLFVLHLSKTKMISN